jgi:PAS domain S-box-containing protein
MNDQNKPKEQLIAELNEARKQLEELTLSSQITKRALQEIEERYRMLVENNPAAIAVHSEGKIQYVNKRALELLGASFPEQIIGKPVFEFLHPDYLEIVKQRVKRIILEPNSAKKPVVEKYIRLDGQIMDLEVSAFPINYNGKKSILVVLIDITERIKAEEELNKLSQSVKQSPNIVVITDKQGKIEYVNPKFTEVTGYTFEEALMKNPGVLKSGYTSNEEYKVLWETISSGKEWRGVFRNKKKNGAFYWESAYIAPIKNAKNEITHFVAVKEDITERRKVEEKLTEAEGKYRELFESVDEGIFIVDEFEEITLVNKAAADIFGCELEDMQGRNLKDFTSEEEYEKIVEQTSLRRQNKPGKYELTILREDNTTRTLSCTVNPIFKDGNYKGAFAIAIDITDKKRTEEELINAKEKAEESDRLKSAFLCTISHELRTPLNAVLGFSQLLFDTEGDQQQIDNYAGIILSSGNHLLSIIEDILDLSIIESGKVNLHPEDINIDELLDELLVFLKSELKISGKTHIQVRCIRPKNSGNIIIHTDTDKLKQVLLNLLKNAIKFTDEGNIEFGYTFEEKHLIRFYVKDTGIGIPKDKHDVIFERFRQLEDTHTRIYGGTGLGLSISKKLVELLNGEIWCESDLGKGSVFHFYLPVTFALKVLKKKKVHTSFDDVDWSDKTILVAEDEDYSFNLLEILLKRSKTRILRGKNGLEAVNIFKSNPGINVVLMDIRMPVMDGYDATRKIKKLNPNVPVIAQTAFAMSEDKDKIFKSGCDDYIAKPLNWDHLLNKLNKYLS